MPSISPTNYNLRKTIFYAAGPGDVVGTFRFWKQGVDDPNETSVFYSSMFFEVCRKLGLKAYIVSSNSNVETLKDGQFMIEHRPRPQWASSGLGITLVG